MTRQTVVCIRGIAAAGKSAVRCMLHNDQRHLLDVPDLWDALEGGFAELPVERVTQAVETGEDLAAVVADAIGDAPALLVNPCHWEDKSLAAVLPRYRVQYWRLMAPGFLLDARQRWRYWKSGLGGLCAVDASLAYAATRGQQIAPMYLRAMELRYGHRCRYGYIDARDLPLRECRPDVAAEMLVHEPGQPDLADPQGQYQQALHVGGIWYGNADRIPIEQRRLDAILPADMHGYDVLDVGASDGAFCWEALSRGARYCMAIERRQCRCSLMRYVRDRCHQAVTVAQLDLERDPIPLLEAYETYTRYRLALLLNVLHHVEYPEAILRKVLATCEECTVETPTFAGTAPCKPGIPPYPGRWHLPLSWLQEVGKSEGFEVASIAVSPLLPDQRVIVKFRRV